MVNEKSNAEFIPSAFVSVCRSVGLDIVSNVTIRLRTPHCWYNEMTFCYSLPSHSVFHENTKGVFDWSTEIENHRAGGMKKE